MTGLTDTQREDIIETLKKGEPLPDHYKYLLFPPEGPDQKLLTQMADDIAERQPPGSGHILIVDDNEFNRDLLTDQLAFQGHTSETAENGRVALEKMRDELFDLVLLDIMMPEMDGYEVLEHMRDDPDLRHLPVVVVYAVDDTKSVVRCIEMGAEDYLFKPIDSVLLRARVNASLEKKHLRDQEQEYLQMLEVEQEKSERLLLNILPGPVATQLKDGRTTIADSFAEVTVLFADIVAFTRFTAEVPAVEMVDILNEIFSTFDQLVEQYHLEKIKTIGDAYMVVGGVPTPRPDHAEAVAEMALDMMDAINSFTRRSGEPFEMRIGINTGPVVAGVIGTKKFIYDLWGDTVNIASRMETSGVAGRIQVTSSTYQALQDIFTFERRGEIDIKGKGTLETYFLTGRR